MSPGTPVAKAALLGWSALALCGCTDSEARREAERVVVAVRALREADDADKPPRLAALRTAECHAQSVCELKQECVGSYELYLSGLEAVRAVKRALASDAGEAATLGAAALLEKAEKDVQRGRERSTKCNEAEARVAAEFKL